MAQVKLMLRKRGRWLNIAKIVRARPLGEMVLAMAYKNRRMTKVVSIPPEGLRLALEAGAKWWVVRWDTLGEIMAYPLDQVGLQGWPKEAYGVIEYYVPVSDFKPCRWQLWDYIDEEVRLNEPTPA